MDEEDFYALVGRRVAEARTTKQMTQGELSSLVGLSRTSITNIERGFQRTPLWTLYLLASGLGVSLKDLIPDDLPSHVPTALDIVQRAKLTRREREILEQALGNGDTAPE